jgi:hypothetical protein
MSLEIVDGASAGDWVRPELSGARGSVTGTVPDRFEAYVRILHPASMQSGAVTWGQVAAELGRTVHPLAQWDAIVGANRYRNETPGWPRNPPATGSLRVEQLGPLLTTLAEHTASVATAFFGIWIGVTWGTVSPAGFSDHSPDDLSYAFPPEQVALPRLRAGREYVVLSGPLSDATVIKGWLSPASPNLIWPEDRAWSLATEIDFDSTLVGGTEGLARAILDDPRFEAFPIGPRDFLTWDADKVNPPLPE